MAVVKITGISSDKILEAASLSRDLMGKGAPGDFTKLLLLTRLKDLNGRQLPYGRSKAVLLAELNGEFKREQPLSYDAKDFLRDYLSSLIKEIAAEATAYLKEKAAANKERSLSANLNFHSFDGRQQIIINSTIDGGRLESNKVANLDLSLGGFTLYDAEGKFHGKRKWGEFDKAMEEFGKQIESITEFKRLC